MAIKIAWKEEECNFVNHADYVGYCEVGGIWFMYRKENNKYFLSCDISRYKICQNVGWGKWLDNLYYYIAKQQIQEKRGKSRTVTILFLFFFKTNIEIKLKCFYSRKIILIKMLRGTLSMFKNITWYWKYLYTDAR